MKTAKATIVETNITATPLYEPLVTNEEDLSDDNELYEWEKGEVQPKEYKDLGPAALFVIHLLIVMYIAYRYSGPAIEKALISRTDRHHYVNYLEAVVSLGIISLIISTLLLRVMIMVGKYLVKTLFYFLTVLSLLYIFATRRSIRLSIFGLIALTLITVYARKVWKRIPVATAHLNVSLSCVKQNFGVVYMAFGYVVLAFIWTVIWLLALIGVKEETKLCDTRQRNCKVNPLILIPFVVSYLWTFQVIKNCVWTAMARVVGTWWFDPESRLSIKKSFIDTRYSFGSICYGALVTPYVQSINEIIKLDGDLVSKFNQWGYIYTGLYGYKYNESATKALKIFRTRQWEPVITDFLLRNTFYVLVFSVAAVMTDIAIISSRNTDWFDNDGGFSPALDASILGFAIGVVSGMIMLAVSSGSVLAVTLLFAEVGDELALAHPALHAKMELAYAKVYPGLMSNSMREII